LSGKPACGLSRAGGIFEDPEDGRAAATHGCIKAAALFEFLLELQELWNVLKDDIL
jgi:hypothetical protein